jgi:D-beta-D-heptose 7-phosphate kinase/D-beta-D-heptose 1-phosphate adenosyltransferase
MPSKYTSAAGEVLAVQKRVEELKNDGKINSSVFQKIVMDYNLLSRKITAIRTIAADCKVVMTIGSFDLYHNGHGRYLEKAKEQGTVLVVGVDSDIAIGRYKGEHRPIIPSEERVEMLARQMCVDFVTLIDDVDKEGYWFFGLLKAIRPDIFVVVEDSYSQDQREEIRKLGPELVVLQRQAQNTSATQIIQEIIKKNPELLAQILPKERK